MNESHALFQLAYRKRTNHILHLLLTLVTSGFWLIPWVLVALSNSIHNRQLERKLPAPRKY